MRRWPVGAPVPSPELVAAWRDLRALAVERVPGWAAEWIVAGYDGPALVRLAGLHGDDPRDVQDILDAALAECGVQSPDPTTPIAARERAAAMQIFNSMAQLHMSGQANARWVMQALLEVANPFLPPSATDLPLGRLAQELPRAGLSFLDHEWGSGGSQRELGLQEAVRVACENQLRLGQTPERPRALRSRPAAVTAPVNEIFARRELDELRASTAARRRCGLPRETSGEYDPLPEPGDTADASVVVAWAERACWDAAAGYTSVVSEWPRVRARLLRDGLVGPPTPEYLVLMVRGLAPLWDGLALDPALLTDEIWRLFQPEEAVLIALNGVEQYPPEGHWWSLNLASLATRGLIEASRLRDSCERAIDGCRWPGKTRFYKRTLKFLATGRTELFLSR